MSEENAKNEQQPMSEENAEKEQQRMSEENAKKEPQPMSEENAEKEQQPMSEENAKKEQQPMSEENSKTEQQRIEELLRSKGMKRGLYPGISVANKGQKVSIKFLIPPGCEVSQLIGNLVSSLGLKVEEGSRGSDMLLRASESAVTWQLTLTRPGKQVQVEKDLGQSKDINAHDGDLCILISGSLNSEKPEIEFIKQGRLSSKELEAFVSVLGLAGGNLGQNCSFGRKPQEGAVRVQSADKSIARLESMGVKIYGLDVSSSDINTSWGNLVGYDQQKREIEDTVLLALRRPEVYDEITHGTRRKFESNRPRAVLFEGPPGTGKTSCARVIANQAGVPLLYVPLESVITTWIGESERNLGRVFSHANMLPNGAIIFLDEIDSFATVRDSLRLSETRRGILSVLLRQIDGFEQDKKLIVVGATNRKQDLDPALLSRFDTMITFGLPDQQSRQAIVAQYAKQLTEPELEEVARVTEGMSGRDIRDFCQQAERSWASKVIRKEESKNEEHDGSLLPPLQEYIEIAISRQKALHSAAYQKKI
ncbi:hypothetical protein ACB092_05G225500 [Castanea dentata]